MQYLTLWVFLLLLFPFLFCTSLFLFPCVRFIFLCSTVFLWCGFISFLLLTFSLFFYLLIYRLVFTLLVSVFFFPFWVCSFSISYFFILSSMPLCFSKIYFSLFMRFYTFPYVDRDPFIPSFAFHFLWYVSEFYISPYFFISTRHFLHAFTFCFLFLILLHWTFHLSILHFSIPFLFHWTCGAIKSSYNLLSFVFWVFFF